MGQAAGKDDRGNPDEERDDAHNGASGQNDGQWRQQDGKKIVHVGSRSALVVCVGQVPVLSNVGALRRFTTPAGMPITADSLRAWLGLANLQGP